MQCQFVTSNHFLLLCVVAVTVDYLFMKVRGADKYDLRINRRGICIIYSVCISNC